jgi:hypothetical protein
MYFLNQHYVESNARPAGKSFPAVFLRILIAGSDLGGRARAPRGIRRSSNSSLSIYPQLQLICAGVSKKHVLRVGEKSPPPGGCPAGHSNLRARFHTEISIPWAITRVLKAHYMTDELVAE